MVSSALVGSCALICFVAVFLVSVASIVAVLLEFASLAVFSSVSWCREHVDVVVICHIKCPVQVLSLLNWSEQVESCESSHLALVCLQIVMVH